MSRSNKTTSQPSKPKFDTKPYERPGLSEADILEIKDAFDIFDREHTGLINPSCTPFAMQNSEMHYRSSAPKHATIPSTKWSSTTTQKAPDISPSNSSSTSSLLASYRKTPEKISTKFSLSSTPTKPDTSASKISAESLTNWDRS
jgi:hypothetical protein